MFFLTRWLHRFTLSIGTKFLSNIFAYFRDYKTLTKRTWVIGKRFHKTTYNYRLPTKLREDNVFRSVCLSAAGGCSVSLPVMDSTTPGIALPPPWTAPLLWKATSPWTYHPQTVSRGHQAGGMHPTGMLSCFGSVSFAFWFTERFKHDV